VCRFLNCSFLGAKERDNETGLDYSISRYYSSIQGRFTSPDAPFAGQDETDPQTWNLYTYTSNNPLSRIDPDGRRWFYRIVNDQTELQWVNPNLDGTYTSPGEGWIEFVPTADNPFLYVQDSNGATHAFGETARGGPHVITNVDPATWTYGEIDFALRNNPLYTNAQKIYDTIQTAKELYEGFNSPALKDNPYSPDNVLKRRDELWQSWKVAEARREAHVAGQKLVKQLKAEGTGQGAGRSGGHGTPKARAGAELIRRGNAIKDPSLADAYKTEGQRLINEAKADNHPGRR
jgi:RHS repeat-associated protein